MKTYLRLLRYVKPYKKRIILSIFAMLILTATTGMTIALIKFTFDKALISKESIKPIDKDLLSKVVTYIFTNIFKIFNIDMETVNPKTYIILIPIALILMQIIKGFAMYAQDYLVNNTGHKVIVDIRNELYAHYHSLPIKFYFKEQTGKLISLISNDVTNIQTAVSSIFTNIIGNSMTIIMLTFIVFDQSWKLSLIALIVFPAAIYPIYKFGARLRIIGKMRLGKIGDMLSVVQESISNIRIVKAFSMEKYEVDKFKKENAQFFSLSMKDLKTSAWAGPLMELIGIIGVSFVVYYGGLMIINKEWTSGALMAFIVAILSLYGPIRSFSGVNNVIQQAIGSAERVFDIIDIRPEVKDIENPITLKNINKSIMFKNVDFSYITDKKVLTNINLEIKTGDVVALVGPSGAGKSTIADLIARFFDPQKGSIEIDGIDIRNISMASLRKQIGIVTQETILFNDSIKANISYGRTEANIDEIINAAKAAYAHEFINATQHGYDSFIGERGVKLSGGQKQRIAIARAILKNPPILILDEATSSLDSESEALVQEALEVLMKDRTTVVIAHRLSTIYRADKIVVIDKGEIIAQGKHSDLLNKCELYKRLYTMQFLNSPTR